MTSAAMTSGVRVYRGVERSFEPYEGFDNRYYGTASIARLVGPNVSATIGCGVATYTRVRTVWELPFDEIIHVFAGAMTVRSAGDTWDVVPGDVLFFPKLVPVEYDVPSTVSVFYVKYPVSA